MTFPCLFACREEKSLRHVAMVARFLDLIKPWSCKYEREKKRQNWHEWLSCAWLNSCRNKTVAHTFPPFSCVGVAHKVSPDWSQKQWYVILSIVLVLFGVRVRRHSDRAAATWPLPSFDNANVRHARSRKIVEVQKFDCHVNVTSHFFLFSYLSTLQSWWKPKKTAELLRHHCRMFSQASRDVKKCYLQALSTQELRGIQTVLWKLRDATASTSGRLYNWSTIDPSKSIVIFSTFEKD